MFQGTNYDVQCFSFSTQQFCNGFVRRMWSVDVIPGFETETLDNGQLGYFLSNKLFICPKQYYANHKMWKQQIMSLFCLCLNIICGDNKWNNDQIFSSVKCNSLPLYEAEKRKMFKKEKKMKMLYMRINFRHHEKAKETQLTIEYRQQKEEEFDTVISINIF